jgi:hypothetical protein
MIDYMIVAIYPGYFAPAVFLATNTVAVKTDTRAAIAALLCRVGGVLSAAPYRGRPVPQAPARPARPAKRPG